MTGLGHYYGQVGYNCGFAILGIGTAYQDGTTGLIHTGKAQICSEGSIGFSHG
jgi:hypothetical protein